MSAKSLNLTLSIAVRVRGAGAEANWKQTQSEGRRGRQELANGPLSTMKGQPLRLQITCALILGTSCTLAACSPAHLPAAPSTLSAQANRDVIPSNTRTSKSLTPSAAFLSSSDGELEVRPPSTFAATRALLIRGGDSPAVKTFAEAATIATGVMAALTYLNPTAATSSLYGLPNTSPLVVWLIRALGGSLAMIAIQAYCIFYREMSYPRAVGFGCLPFMINEIRTLVLNETRQWDMAPWGLLFISLPISSSCAYMLINMSDKPFAKKVVKAFAFWVLVGNGLPLGLAPEAAANGWGINHEEEGVLGSLKLIGFTDIAAAFLMMMLDKNIDSSTAFSMSFALLSGLLAMECMSRFTRGKA